MSQVPIRDLSILIVEPSITATRYIEDQLKSLEIRNINCCGRGAEALSSMLEQPPDLVASAMYLPDLTAIQLIETMRCNQELKDIPFMLISTETSFAKLEPIRQAGIIAILPKPFSIADLRKALVGTRWFVNEQEADVEQTELMELKVLVVDDSAMSRKHISRVLTNLGIEDITEATNGQEAVQLLERHLFDIVFTDYNMPEMDGEALTRYIRQNSIQRDIPVLMVTSEENNQRLSAVQQAGVSGICDKPFEPETVVEMIQQVRMESGY